MELSEETIKKALNFLFDVDKSDLEKAKKYLAGFKKELIENLQIKKISIANGNINILKECSPKEKLKLSAADHMIAAINDLCEIVEKNLI